MSTETKGNSKPTLVRGVDPRLWKLLRHRAIAEDKYMGQVLNEILAEALGPERKEKL